MILPMQPLAPARAINAKTGATAHPDIALATLVCITSQQTHPQQSNSGCMRAARDARFFGHKLAVAEANSGRMNFMYRHCVLL